MKSSVYILWLEGINPEGLAAIPALAMMLTRGVDLHLIPQPLVEPGQCYYQALTGMGSGKFGRFDAMQPEGYRVHENHDTPDGAQGHLLPDILRQCQLAVTSLEVNHKDILNTLKEQTSDFALIRLLDAGALTPDALNTLVEQCLELLSPSSHLLVLTDVWSPAPKAFVNINDFLADIGLLEIGEPRHQADIIWSETLAYGLGTGQIWINLRGREPQGVVSMGREYRDVCDALIRELRSNWLDPQTNEPVVEQVFKRMKSIQGIICLRPLT